MIKYIKSNYKNFSSTKYLFISFAILRLIGLLKFALIANIFGKSLVSDSYFYTMFIIQIALTISDSGGPLYLAGISLLNSQKDKKSFHESLIFILLFFSGIFILCGLFIFLFINYIPKFLMPLMDTNSILFIKTSSLIIKEVSIILPTIFTMGIFTFLVAVSHFYGYYIFDIIFHLLLTIVEIVFILLFNKTWGIYSAFWGFNIGFLISTIVSILFFIPFIKNILLDKASITVDGVKKKYNHFIYDLIPNLGIFITYFIKMFFFNSACSYFAAGSRTNFELAHKVSTYPNIILRKIIYTPMYTKLCNSLKKDGKNSFEKESIDYINKINLILIPVAFAMVYFSKEIMNIAYLNKTIDMTEPAIILSILSIALLYSSFEFVYRNIAYALNDFKLSFIIDLLCTVSGIAVTLILLKPIGIIAIPIGLSEIALMKSISYTMASIFKYKIKPNSSVFYNYLILTVISILTVLCLQLFIRPN